jgi:teichuronic acid biosynthesis glycosyltransferase TuaG
MAKQPLVSVCVPPYKNGEFIADNLNTVLQQTCGNFEIIVTDDRSTDETVSVMKTFANPRIKLDQHDRDLGIVIRNLPPHDRRFRMKDIAR